MSQIAFVSQFIGVQSGTGSVLSAADTLMALLTTTHSIVAINQSHAPLPSTLGGYRVKAPQWIHLPRPLRDPLGGPIARRIASRLWAWWHYGKLRTLKPDLLIVDSFANQKLVERLPNFSLASAGRSALIIRDTPTKPYYFSDSEFVWAVEVAARFDYLIFLSERIREAWHAISPLAEKPSFVLPNCCREEIVASFMERSKADVRQQLGLALDNLLVVCVGSIQPRKGQDMLVELFPRLRQALPKLHLCLLGPGESEWGRNLRDQVAQSKFRDHFHFLGNKPNALDYIFAADFLVLPTRAEALSRAILEAMALKTGILTTQTGGMPDLIEHERSGLLVPPDDREEFSAAFIRLGQDPRLRSALAEEAHARYQANFQCSHLVRRYQEAVDVMLDAAGSRTDHAHCNS